MAQQDVKLQVQENVSRIKTVRDQLRLDVHLAGMEAKTRYEQLEKQFRAAEHKIATEFTEATQKISKDLLAAYQDLKKTLRA